MTKPTSLAMAPSKASALNVMASRYSVEPAKLYETLKTTIFPKATDAEMLALIVVANEYKLNVMLRELYAFPAKGGGIVPVVSVDGWNSLLIRQPDFDGIEFEFVEGEDGVPFSCTATIYVKSRSHPVKITEYFSECVRATEPWKNMPHRMLRNRTLCQASRVAFGFSGVYHEEEADTITVDSIVTPAMPQLPPPKVVPPADGVTPQMELESVVVGAGYTLENLKTWGGESGNIEKPEKVLDFASIPTEVCRRLLRARREDFLKGLETVKAETGEAE